MAKILELLDDEVKATSINMLRDLVENMDNMQEYVDNGSRDQTLRENHKEVKAIKMSSKK